jgi:DNA-binding XRE family transcriptional regulator
MTFAEKVMEVRGRLLISQEQLAKELNVSFATINRWEKGHNEPSFIMQRKFNELCQRFDIKFDDVFGEKNR